MKLEDQNRMSIDFNTNTGKKEDVSNRLRAHNIRRARDETKKLETESKKMEERLKELRMAMNREKEEREKSGGGYWSRGQTGNLNSYATDVLNKPGRSSKEGKKKVKVLKDSPINLPERPKQPGTMGYIAQQDPSTGNTPRSKVKGPKCGQCEEKKAAVSCVQCSELYCPSCFAAFHLRGALKKHRSVPISAAGPRVCMSPRPGTPQNNRNSIEFHSSPQGGAENHTVNRIQLSHRDRNGPEGASGSFDDVPSSLLTGDYDESESAASFQQALMAWRSGDEPAKAATPRVPYSPVKSPIVHVDSGTATVEKTKPLEIKFHSNLTYAERLLLKQHRRTDLQHMETPRLAGLPPSFDDSIGEGRRSISVTPRNYPRAESNDTDPWIQGHTTPRVQPFPVWQEGVDQDDMEAERVSFHALYQAVKTSQPERKQNKDDMDIVELDTVAGSDGNSSSTSKKSKRNGRLEETSVCTVQEVDDLEAWSVGNQNIKSNSKQDVFQKSEQQPPPPKSSQRNKNNSARTVTPSESTTQNSESNLVYNKRHENAYSQDVSLHNSSRPSSSHSRPKSSARPRSSAKYRPQSSNNRRTQQSRPGSRAKSRMESEGLLTKGPSQGLTQVAMMGQQDKQKSYNSAFNDFFMLGVKPEQTERTMTPSSHKGSQIDKVKVSGRLYQMSPQSWRPDSSLANNVPSAIVQVDESVHNMMLQTEDELLPDCEMPGVKTSNENGRNSVQSIRQLQSRSDIINSLTGSLQFDEKSSQRYDVHSSDDDTFPELPPTPKLRMTTPRSAGVRSRPDSGTPRPESNNSRPRSRRLPKPFSQDQRSSSRFSQEDFDDITPRPDSITPCPISTTSPRPTSETVPRPPSRTTPRPTSRTVPRPSSRTTPKPSSRTTPRPSSRTMSFHRNNDEEGRESRAIVMDGDDLSSYDAVGESQVRNMDDQETLDNLEWELASETGRITDDGKISRMSLSLDIDDTESNGSAESVRSFSRMSQQDQGYDINSRLREDELLDDDDSDGDADEEDVKALH